MGRSNPLFEFFLVLPDAGDSLVPLAFGCPHLHLSLPFFPLIDTVIPTLLRNQAKSPIGAFS